MLLLRILCSKYDYLSVIAGFSIDENIDEWAEVVRLWYWISTYYRPLIYSP